MIRERKLKRKKNTKKIFETERCDMGKIFVCVVCEEI
jgi:hypothetical protein